MYHMRLRKRRRQLILNSALNSVMEPPSWVRRGHIRKPNWVVLMLYAIFDWFGDFGPMFRSLGRGIGKTAKGTWTFIVRAVLIIINILLMAGIIYVSVGHSYSMLVLAGMSGIAAVVFVGVWETVFIYCSILIDLDSAKGRKSNWAPWVGFLMGFVFVLVSNYISMAESLLGKSIGISTPILLLVMKKVLQYQFRKPKKEKKSWFSRFWSWFSQLWRGRKTTLNSHSTELNSHQNSNEISSHDEGAHNKTEEEKSSQVEKSHGVKSLKNAEVRESQFSRSTDSHTRKDEEGFSEKEKKSSHEVTLAHEKSHVSRKEISSENDDSHNSQRNTHAQNESHKKSTSQTKRYTLQKKSHIKSSQDGEELLTDLEEIKKVALELFVEKGGTYPSIRELKEKAPCSEWLSRKALSQLKQAN